jgi:RimJ/RimL family protein N-acetyltransferase
VELRLLEERDLEVVRELRNRNRRWFFHDGEISSEQQSRWFAALAEAPVRFYVLVEEDEVVGTVSATDTPAGVEIGNLLVRESHRGRGLMRRAIEELTATPGRYYARVRPDNADSLRVFERSGFATAHVVLEKDV